MEVSATVPSSFLAFDSRPLSFGFCTCHLISPSPSHCALFRPKRSSHRDAAHPGYPTRLPFGYKRARSHPGRCTIHTSCCLGSKFQPRIRLKGVLRMDSQYIKIKRVLNWHAVQLSHSPETFMQEMTKGFEPSAIRYSRLHFDVPSRRPVDFLRRKFKFLALLHHPLLFLDITIRSISIVLEGDGAVPAP